MLVRLLANLLLNPINIPLRRSAFAARRCPPSKGDVGLASAIGAGVVFSDIPLRRFAFAARRCPPSEGEKLEPGHAFYQQPPYNVKRKDAS